MASSDENSDSDATNQSSTASSKSSTRTAKTSSVTSDSRGGDPVRLAPCLSRMDSVIRSRITKRNSTSGSFLKQKDQLIWLRCLWRFIDRLRRAQAPLDEVLETIQLCYKETLTRSIQLKLKLANDPFHYSDHMQDLLSPVESAEKVLLEFNNSFQDVVLDDELATSVLLDLNKFLEWTYEEIKSIRSIISNVLSLDSKDEVLIRLIGCIDTPKSRDLVANQSKLLQLESEGAPDEEMQKMLLVENGPCYSELFKMLRDRCGECQTRIRGIKAKAVESFRLLEVKTGPPKAGFIRLATSVSSQSGHNAKNRVQLEREAFRATRHFLLIPETAASKEARERFQTAFTHSFVDFLPPILNALSDIENQLDS